jgi:hypothetical protein
VHTDTLSGDDIGSHINRWIRRIYLTLIIGVVGLMLAHNFLSWRKRVLALYYSADRTVLRMDNSQRVQHLIGDDHLQPPDLLRPQRRRDVHFPERGLQCHVRASQPRQGRPSVAQGAAKQALGSHAA